MAEENLTDRRLKALKPAKRLGGVDIYQNMKPNLEHIVECIPAEPAGE